MRSAAVRDLARPACRRAYYRVNGSLPIRAIRLAPDEVDKAVFELSLQHSSGDEEESALLERLRRIEEKLDLLLAGDVEKQPAPLGAADLECVVFSGAGLSMPIDDVCVEGDAFRIEILLPGPDSRTLHSVARAVADSTPMEDGVARHQVALALEHMNEDDRDALVAYSYELQRMELRSREPREFRA